MIIGSGMFGKRNNNKELLEILTLCQALGLDSDEIVNTFNKSKLKVKLKKLRTQAQREGLDLDYYKEK